MAAYALSAVVFVLAFAGLLLGSTVLWRWLEERISEFFQK